MSIPKHAQKVFTGKIFDVYQWEQKMFDGTVETFESLKRLGSVQILPIIGDKIMVAEEEQPTFSKRIGLISGVIEEGENARNGAEREMLEETGYIATQWELYRERNLYNKIDWTVSCFIARNCTKIAEPRLDPGERIITRLVSFDEFMDILMHPDFRSKDLTLDILKLHYHGKLDQFKKMLFS